MSNSSSERNNPSLLNLLDLHFDNFTFQPTFQLVSHTRQISPETMSLLPSLPSLRSIKSLVLGSPPEDDELPARSSSSKRKASHELPRKTKHRIRESPHSPREYQSAPYRGSATVTATEGVEVEDAGPAYPRLQSALKESKKPTRPTKVASPDRVRMAIEARRLLAEGQKKYESIRESEGSRIARGIWRPKPMAETVAENLSEAVEGQKEKAVEEQPLQQPIREIQPDIEDLSDFDDSEVSEIPDKEKENIESPRRTVHTPIPSPSPLAKKAAATAAKAKTQTRKIAQKQPRKPKTPTTTIRETKPKGWDGFTTPRKWSTKPNLRAREIVNTEPPLRAKAFIQRETNEPDYAFRDAEIRDSLWQIMDQIERFANAHFRFEYQPEDGVVPREWYEGLSPQTAKVIACVASGGPAGVHGWHDLFIDEHKRRAVVCAIIGNVLVEQVFQHDFFGGSESDIKAVRGLQEKYCKEDGKFSLDDSFEGEDFY